MSGTISFADINPGDMPTVQARVFLFTYQNAQHGNVTASLTAEQIAAIKAVEVPLTVVQDPNGKNFGTATWTYNVPDGAFDFLAAGETLTLTYMARVDNNYAPNNETTFMPFTITITGTNDTPTAQPPAASHRADRHRQYRDRYHHGHRHLHRCRPDRPAGRQRGDLQTDRSYHDAKGNDVTASLTPEQLAAILAVEIPLSVVQAAATAITARRPGPTASPTASSTSSPRTRR